MTKSKLIIQQKWVPNIHKNSVGVTLLILLAIIFNGCGKEDSQVEILTGLKITGVSIPSGLNVVPKGDITLTGKGFTTGDQVRFTSSSDPARTYTASVKSVTDQTFSFALPEGISSGSFKITVIRGAESLLLGSTMINIIADTTIPDVPGMTIKGVVYCNGEGISGVAVSDGYEVTTTDANGKYYLASLKKNGYVFISVPGNYEVTQTNNAPQFFQRLVGGSVVEQKDFSLIRVNNHKHAVLTMADWHLANRNDDLSQFTGGFLSDVNATISKYQAAGVKVYGLTLGDMSWDAYWYENFYALPEYLTQMYKINCTIFNTMGNHDNDPYSVGDWLAEDKYKKVIGPNYYSFNLGNVHYIVLDNVEYINTGGGPGVIGDRNYNDIINAEQMGWLKKDLAILNDKDTPVIIAMHVPLYKKPTLDAGGNEVISYSLNNSSELVAALHGFTKVHILSGHTHINYSVETDGSLMEHNTAAVCATWWWTGKSGYAGNHICTDGSPGGYGV